MTSLSSPTRAFWQRLGLPGLFDVHVHFLPPNIQRRVWEQFDMAGPKIGRKWPIRYRDSLEERVALLRELGVRRFSALPYAHQPGVAAYLNDWARQFATDVPESLWSATFYPEPEAADVRRRAGRRGRRGLQDPRPGRRLPARRPGAGRRLGAPGVERHAGRRARGLGAGAQRLHRTRAARARAGSLAAVSRSWSPTSAPRSTWSSSSWPSASSGCTWTPRWPSRTSSSRWRRTRLRCCRGCADLGEKVLLGSDFPTIPYPYLHQLESLERLGLGEHWLRAVCWDNGARLFGMNARGTPR